MRIKRPALVTAIGDLNILCALMVLWQKCFAKKFEADLQIKVLFNN